jgi:hypothetical protein
MCLYSLHNSVCSPSGVYGRMRWGLFCLLRGEDLMHALDHRVAVYNAEV